MHGGDLLNHIQMNKIATAILQFVLRNLLKTVRGKASVAGFYPNLPSLPKLVDRRNEINQS